MKKYCLALAIILSALGISAGIWNLLMPLLPSPGENPHEDAAFYLRDTGGRVGVYDTPDSNAPLAVYDIYVNLLPEMDALRLKSGIRVYGDTALEALLEDFGA